MDIAARILLVEDGVNTQSFTLNADGALIVGKAQAGEPVDIEVPSSFVSRRHASIRSDAGGALFVCDLGSTNGTLLNGMPIEAGVDIALGDGAIITFPGDDQYLLQVTDSPASAVEPRARRAARTGASQSQSIFDALRNKDTVIIGRSPECDIVIEDQTVSRQHARIDKTGPDSYRITDLESTNGTFVNGRKLGGQTDLGLDDLILIGDFSLSLKGAARDIRKEIAIQAEQIVKQYPNGYIGLQETTLTIPAQSLLAIMGPSGCGKSTLMKALNGDDPISSGRVFIHGLELANNYEYLKPRIGYVPQDDIVHAELSVEKSLYFAAKLRMDNPDSALIKAKIDRILNDLNIEHIRHNLVGRISGGQRKRVSIAVELLTDPLLLFLDEPTSPLDPQTIEEFLRILKRLAEKGTTVIMVTHKPEDLNYMDSVIFLAEGGYLAFYGPTGDYKTYFEVDNAVEVYADICGEKARHWARHFRRNQKAAGTGEAAPASRQPPKLKTSALRQTFWLTARYLNVKVNDRLNTVILIAQAPIIALLLSLIFQDIEPALPFLISISAIWFGTSNAAREIVGELPIYRRERMFNLKITPYILSKLAVLSLFSAVQVCLFIAILALRFSDTLFAGVDPTWNQPLASAAWMMFLSVSAAMMGLLLSAAVNTTEKVMTLVPIILIPQIILAGAIARITSWGIELASWLTLARWGTEGLNLIQGKVYTEQTVVTSVVNDKGEVLSTESAKQGGAVDAVDALNGYFLPAYREREVFGDLTNTLTLDASFIAALGALFFILTWVLLRRKDTL